MVEPSSAGPEAQRVADEMQRKRREAVQRIAERNKQAHERAKRKRKEYDRFVALNRGPNAR